MESESSDSALVSDDDEEFVTPHTHVDGVELDFPENCRLPASGLGIWTSDLGHFNKAYLQTFYDPSHGRAREWPSAFLIYVNFDKFREQEQDQLYCHHRFSGSPRLTSERGTTLRNLSSLLESIAHSIQNSSDVVTVHIRLFSCIGPSDLKPVDLLRDYWRQLRKTVEPYTSLLVCSSKGTELAVRVEDMTKGRLVVYASFHSRFAGLVQPIKEEYMKTENQAIWTFDDDSKFAALLVPHETTFGAAKKFLVHFYADTYHIFYEKVDGGTTIVLYVHYHTVRKTWGEPRQIPKMIHLHGLEWLADPGRADRIRESAARPPTKRMLLVLGQEAGPFNLALNHLEVDTQGASEFKRDNAVYRNLPIAPCTGSSPSFGHCFHHNAILIAFANLSGSLEFLKIDYLDLGSTWTPKQLPNLMQPTNIAIFSHPDANIVLMSCFGEYIGSREPYHAFRLDFDGVKDWAQHFQVTCFARPDPGNRTYFLLDHAGTVLQASTFTAHQLTQVTIWGPVDQPQALAPRDTDSLLLPCGSSSAAACLVNGKHHAEVRWTWTGFNTTISPLAFFGQTERPPRGTERKSRILYSPISEPQGDFFLLLQNLMAGLLSVQQILNCNADSLIWLAPFLSQTFSHTELLQFKYSGALLLGSALPAWSPLLQTFSQLQVATCEPGLAQFPTSVDTEDSLFVVRGQQFWQFFGRLWNVSDSQRKETFKSSMERNPLHLYQQVMIADPFRGPEYLVHAVEVLKVFSSKTRPVSIRLFIAPKQRPGDLELYEALFKRDEDMKNELHVQTLFSVFNYLWQASGLKSKPNIRTLRIAPTGTSRPDCFQGQVMGLVEFVNSRPYFDFVYCKHCQAELAGTIRVSVSGDRCCNNGKCGGQEDRVEEATKVWDDMVRSPTFLPTLVGGYALIIGDRHEHNRLIIADRLPNGEIEYQWLEIDFGWILGPRPSLMGLSVPTEVLQIEIVRALERAGLAERFWSDCAEAFLVLRRHCGLICDLIDSLFPVPTKQTGDSTAVRVAFDFAMTRAAASASFKRRCQAEHWSTNARGGRRAHQRNHRNDPKT